MDTFSTACNELDLTITLKKTTALYQTSTDKCLVQIKIYVYSQKLHVGENFVYLGNTVNRKNTLDDAICIRNKKATNAFRKLDRHL